MSLSFLRLRFVPEGKRLSSPSAAYPTLNCAMVQFPVLHKLRNEWREPRNVMPRGSEPSDGKSCARLPTPPSPSSSVHKRDICPGCLGRSLGKGMMSVGIFKMCRTQYFSIMNNFRQTRNMENKIANACVLSFRPIFMPYVL